MENLTQDPGGAPLKCTAGEPDAVVRLRAWVSPRVVLAAGRLAILAFSVAACSSSPAAEPGGLSGEISPGDERIHYEGRID